MLPVVERSANSPIIWDMNVALLHYIVHFSQGQGCIFFTHIPGTLQGACDGKARGARTGLSASLPRFLLVTRENRIWGKENCAPSNIPRGFTSRVFWTRALSFTPHTHEGSVPRPTLRSLDELSQNESAFIRVLGPQSVPKWEQDLCGLLSKVATCQHHCLKFKVQPIVI